MENVINVFDIEISADSAKEIVRKIAMHLEEERIYTVSALSLEMLLQEKDNENWKRQLQTMDILFPGDKEIFRAADNAAKGCMKQTDKKELGKLLLRYLQKNKKTLFLLAEKESELVKFENDLRRYCPNIKIIGKSVLAVDSEEKDKVVNEINGVEPDCIFAALSCPWQTQFINENRALINARAWVGFGSSIVRNIEKKSAAVKLQTFILKKMFRYHLEKHVE